jgi:hypothetical protein
MEQNFLQLLQDYWTIIFFVGSLIWSYANLKGHVRSLHDRTNVLEKKCELIESKLEEMNPIWAEIKERLAGIEATLKFLTKEK